MAADLFGGPNGKGDHRAWKRLRASFAAQLPLPCARCSELIRPGDGWDLGHRVPRVNGGSHDMGVWPEHARCSRSAGGRLGAERRAAQNGHAGRARVTERTGMAGRTLESSVCAGSVSGSGAVGRCAGCLTLGASCNGRGAHPGYGPGLAPSRAW